MLSMKDQDEFMGSVAKKLFELDQTALKIFT